MSSGAPRRFCYDGLHADQDLKAWRSGRLHELRDTWWMRAYMHWFNLTRAVRRAPDRYLIHRHARLDRLMADAGYLKIHERGTLAWRFVAYGRADGHRNSEAW